MEFTMDEFKSSMKEVLEEAEQKATLTVRECSKLTGIRRDKIMELAHSRDSDFPCFRVGAKFLINRDMLMKWLKRVTEEGRVL